MRISVPISAFRRLFLLVMVFSSVAVHGQEPQGPPEQNPKYAGSDVCESCHEDRYKTFSKSVHVETLKSKDPTKRGCEGCHGPGVEHANAGDPDAIQRYSGVKPEVILARCGTCHESQISQSHIKAHLSCLTCHSVHHASQSRMLLVRPAQEICRRCHTSK